MNLIKIITVYKESKPKRSHAIEPLGMRAVWKVVMGSGQVLCLDLSAGYISIHWVKKLQPVHL